MGAGLQEPGLGVRELRSSFGSAGNASVTVGKSHASAELRFLSAVWGLGGL